jgi:hypothetical protein
MVFVPRQQRAEEHDEMERVLHTLTDGKAEDGITGM